MWKNTDYNLSPLDILEHERRYPGLLEDLITHLNYRHLIKEESQGN